MVCSCWQHYRTTIEQSSIVFCEIFKTRYGVTESQNAILCDGIFRVLPSCHSANLPSFRLTINRAHPLYRVQVQGQQVAEAHRPVVYYLCAHIYRFLLAADERIRIQFVIVNVAMYYPSVPIFKFLSLLLCLMSVMWVRIMDQ